MAKKIVLAYSGGLDTSAIVPWLINEKGCEVVAYAADVGQGADELSGIEEKALSSGACHCIVDDLRAELVEEYIWPSLRAGAIYENTYLLGTSIARPVIAKGQVKAARSVGADGLAHGCTGKGNDQVRFETAFAALAPDLEIIAPWREWDFRSRHDLLEYCAKHSVPVTSSAEKLYSRDRNLWHVSHEGGAIEDPTAPPPDDAWMLTNALADTPDEPDHVRISFQSGVPVALDGQMMDGVELIQSLNTIAGLHGIGRVDLVENRVVGMKSRGLYETPAGTVLHEALRGLEDLTLDARTRKLKAQLMPEMAELIYAGKWFGDARRAISAAADVICERSTGEVTVRLFKGNAFVVTRESQNSLYSEALATFDEDELYEQADANGFIRLFSLPERVSSGQYKTELVK
ncbi:MAG: argininosuccinate synthase [Phycisphaerales bacterium]